MSRAREEITRTVIAWGIDDKHEDPTEVLMRMLTVSYRRAAYYSELLESQHVNEHVAGLIGTRRVYTESGAVDADEYIRGLTRLEAEERDRAARLAKLALDFGLEERMVRLAETEAKVIVQAIDQMTRQLGLTEEQENMVPEVAERVLKSISGGLS